MDLKVTEYTEGQHSLRFSPFAQQVFPKTRCVAGSLPGDARGSREDSEPAMPSRGSQPGGKTDLNTDEGEVVGNGARLHQLLS